MFRYKMHYPDGSEAGDAAYADNVNSGDELMLGPGKFKCAVVERVAAPAESDAGQQQPRRPRRRRKARFQLGTHTRLRGRSRPRRRG